MLDRIVVGQGKDADARTLDAVLVFRAKVAVEGRIVARQNPKVRPTPAVCERLEPAGIGLGTSTTLAISERCGITAL